MERELASKVFMVDDYASKNNMEEQIKEYIRKLKNDYPDASITREFYKGKNILIRATEVGEHKIIKNYDLEKEELWKGAGRIIEKGINGIGENVYKDKGKTKGREHTGGNGRERY